MGSERIRAHEILDGLNDEADACLGASGELYARGEGAINALQKFIADRKVYCTDAGPDTKHKSRRLGQCFVRHPRRS